MRSSVAELRGSDNSHAPSAYSGRNGRIADAAYFTDLSLLEHPFHHFIAEQGEDPALQEQGPRIAIPVHAGRAAAIVRCWTGTRGQRTEFRQCQTTVAQVQDGGGRPA